MTLMRLIIFDFDGVIADSLHYIHKVLDILADKHGFRHVSSDEQFSDLLNENLLTMVSKLDIPKHLLPVIYLEYKNMMKREYKDIHIYKGMPELLKALAHDKDNILVIVSSNHKDLIEYLLEHHGLKDCFAHILGAEFSYHKDHKLQHLMKELRPEKAFFVTDTLGDVKDAKKVEGLTTIGARWGYHTWSDKDSVKPDFIIDTPAGIEDIVKR